jgi:nucleoside-diphosphate-sugar epimerase
LGDGKNKIQFLSAIELMLMIKKSFNLKGKHIFNIGTENNLTIKDIFQFLIKKTNSKSKIIYINKKIGLFFLKFLSTLKLINFIDYHNKLLVSNIVMDISRIKKKLQYKPKKNNAELLLEAYKFYAKKKYPEFGSGAKPIMRFFNVIKFLSKFFNKLR